MKRVSHAVIIALTMLVMTLSVTACTAVKTTQPGTIGLDRKQYMSPLVPEAQLNAGAASAYAKVLAEQQSKGTLNSDARMTARVRRIADRIVPQVKVFRPQATRWDWEVNVFNKDELNAWCMPGGKIAFYSGIINRLKLTDSEIAAIMGHEIAHALREHARERASEQATSGLLITAGAVAIGAGSTAVDMAGLAYQSVFGLKHSRMHETEADRVGIELSARAGYDPNAAISLWQKMARASGPSGPEWLSTHPSSRTRIADLRKYAARVHPLYLSAKKRR